MCIITNLVSIKIFNWYQFDSIRDYQQSSIKLGNEVL